MNALYQTIDISKQAVHRYAIKEQAHEEKLRVLIREVEDLRKEHPGCGVEKMYYTLSPDFIGRDKFIEEFMGLGFRLKHKKNYRRTTYAANVYYPNLIKGMEIKAPNIIWQTDITYIEVERKFYYAVFIIDVYTKEIVGYSISDHMRATANVKAMSMAIKTHGAPRIHHSDRGSQYIYKDYIALLKRNGITISMALTAQDNAYAERINQTIKKEYLDYWDIRTFVELKRSIKKAVENYNTQRIHNHLERRIPERFRKFVLTLTEKDRPTEIIYSEGNDKKMTIKQLKQNRIINPKTVNLI